MEISCALNMLCTLWGIGIDMNMDMIVKKIKTFVNTAGIFLFGVDYENVYKNINW